MQGSERLGDLCGGTCASICLWARVYREESDRFGNNQGCAFYLKSIHQHFSNWGTQTVGLVEHLFCGPREKNRRMNSSDQFKAGLGNEQAGTS